MLDLQDKQYRPTLEEIGKYGGDKRAGSPQHRKEVSL